MAEQRVTYGSHDASQGTFTAYIVGFITSVVLTLAAFIAVSSHIHSQHPPFSTAAVIGFVVCLAIIQLFMQLVCFLHVGRESKPRWNLTALIFALIVVLIVVVGSLWIMSNLNYRMMSSPAKVNQYLREQDRL